MGKSLFVTGTDTGIGKTWISVGLMAAFRRQGRSVAGMKPVASGCHVTVGGLRNSDAEAILALCSTPQPYERVNPYAFEPAIAPLLAAREAGVSIDLSVIGENYQRLVEEHDWTVVEGVGGWKVPLSGALSVADLARHLELPVLLVVGLRLGCVNHALLTVESILAAGGQLAGWVANLMDFEMERPAENIRDLALRIPAPLLGVVPWMRELSADAVADALDVSLLEDG